MAKPDPKTRLRQLPPDHGYAKELDALIAALRDTVMAKRGRLPPQLVIAGIANFIGAMIAYLDDPEITEAMAVQMVLHNMRQGALSATAQEIEKKGKH